MTVTGARPPVLFVLPSGTILRGGARSNLLLAEHLVGFQPHVLTLRGSGVAEACRRRGIPVHEADVDANSRIDGRIWGRERLSAYKSLVVRGRALARRLRPRIVQADYEHFPIACGIGWVGSKTVLCVRGWLTRGVHRRALMKLIAADAVVVLSGSIRDAIVSGAPAVLRRHLVSKLFVIHNSVPLAEEAGPPGQTATAAVVGGLESNKGQLELLLEWCSRVETRPMALQLIGDEGDSEYAARCRAVIARDGVRHAIEMTGFQSDMPARYRGVDVLVCASQREGIPRAIIEAASHGVPAVSLDFPGVDEAVIPDTTGVVCRNMRDLVDAVIRLHRDPALRRTYGSAARDHIRRHFDPRRTAELLEHVYDPLARCT